MDRRDIRRTYGFRGDRAVTIGEIEYEGKNIIDATRVPMVIFNGMIALEGGVPTGTTGERVLRDDAGCTPVYAG